MKSVSVEDQRTALRVFVAYINTTKTTIKVLETDVNNLYQKLQRLEEFKSELERGIKDTVHGEEQLIESLKKLPNIGAAAVFLATLSPEGTITAAYAKRLISDRAKLGTSGAIFAYFSRTEDFETVGRGKYKLSRLHSIPQPTQIRRIRSS